MLRVAVLGRMDVANRSLQVTLVTSPRVQVASYLAKCHGGKLTPEIYVGVIWFTTHLNLRELLQLQLVF